MAYVYIYLDPRKKGKYFYNGLNYSFLYEPFYIGKGTRNKRMKEHMQPYNLKKYKNYKTNKILNIKQENKNPYILKLEDNLTEEYSLELEVKLIKIIGRYIDEIPGPLTNTTNGGDGVYMRDEAARKKIGDFHRGKTLSKEHVEKIRQANKGQGLGGKLDPETKKKISDTLKRKYKTGEILKILPKTKKKGNTIYKIISPDLKIYYTFNLKMFCKRHDLLENRMSDVASNLTKQAKHHKNWKCIKIGKIKWKNGHIHQMQNM